MTLSSLRSLLAVVLFGMATLLSTDAKPPHWVPAEGIGRVHMPISCARVQDEFDRGLALLHSFWYDRALDVFDDVIANDPRCRIAYWGAAMTYNHPLWAPPTNDDVAAALKYLHRGSAAPEYNAREAGYFHAVTTVFGDGKPKAKPQRDVRYMNEMAHLYAKFPDDETALFYALSIEGSPGYESDPARIEKAGALAKMVHAHQPNHPGALHYTIHAYDEPGFEQRALSAARAYAASAPEIPHALHMPSHTFVALGLWDESNRTNARAWAASESSVKAAGEPEYDRDFHILWFYLYGEIQAGHYAKARQLRDIALTEYRGILAGYRAMPAEKADEIYDASEVASTIEDYAYETRDYTAVGVLEPAGLYGVDEASRLEVQALAMLSAHNLANAQDKAGQLQRLVASMNAPDYSLNSRRYASVAREEVVGLNAIAAGRVDSGLASLKDAARDEDGLPGGLQPIAMLPAHELYAGELSKAGRYAEAAANYRVALKKMPNRPMALLGLATAARHMHDPVTEGEMSTKFKHLWKTADSDALKNAAANTAY